MPTQLLAVSNQKGGVGKSTTTVNLGTGLARTGKKVLLVDADPQANLTQMLGWQQPERLDVTLSSFMEAYLSDMPLPWQDGILHGEEGVDLLPSNIELSGTEVGLFQTEEERQENQHERVQNLPLGMFYPFPNHPFQVRDDEKMEETVQSVSQYGILIPVLARPRAAGGYELVAGHRRHHACQLAGLAEIPAIIRDLNDDEATIIMVDSNLQRDHLLPSEKAFAYKMKLDAMKRQGKRSDLTSGQIGQKLKYSVELLADEAGESYKQVQRYIRLTNLVHPILDMVDENKFAFNAAYEISFIPLEHQELLIEAMDYAQASPTLDQA